MRQQVRAQHCLGHGAPRGEYGLVRRALAHRLEVGVGLRHDHVGQRTGPALREFGEGVLIGRGQALRCAVAVAPFVPGRDIRHQLVGLRQVRRCLAYGPFRPGYRSTRVGGPAQQRGDLLGGPAYRVGKSLGQSSPYVLPSH